MSGRPLTDLFPVTGDTRLDVQFLSGLLRELEARLSGLQILREGLEAAISSAQTIALSRVDDILGPSQTEIASRIADADAAVEAANDAVAAAQAQLDALMAQQFEISQINGLSSALSDAAKSVVVSSAHTAEPGQQIAADVSGGGFPISLPEPTGRVAGETVSLKLIGGDPSADPLTIEGNGGTINGKASFVVDAGLPLGGMAFIHNGSEWRFA